MEIGAMEIPVAQAGQHVLEVFCPTPKKSWVGLSLKKPY